MAMEAEPEVATGATNEPVAATGAARRARMRRQRAEARKVTWLSGLLLAVKPHHTASGHHSHAAGTSSRSSAPEAAGHKGQMLAQVADVHLQIEALAHIVEDLRIAFERAGLAVACKPEPADKHAEVVKTEAAEAKCS